MNQSIQFELSKEYLDHFKEAVDSQNVTFIKDSLSDAMPEDISALLNEFDSEESKYVLDLLDDEVGADIIKGLEEDTRTKFFKIFEPAEISKFVNLLDSDDGVDILNDLPVKTREEVIALLDNKEKEAYILDLMRYEDDCAGGLMAKELIKANFNWTVVQCIEEIRRQAESVEKIYSVYVVDDQDKLLGRVSLKEMILANDNKHISDIYEKDIISVETYMSEEEVASIMQKYDLDAVPVVNVTGKLLGRITIDDVVDVITELAEEERNLMAGISEDVEEDDSIWMLSRARLPWLLIGVVGGLLSARFMGLFEDDLLKQAAIAFFIPLIQATGGNVGIQSSSIVVQSLANPSAFDDSMWRRLFKVLLVALLNGLVLASIVLTVNLLIGEQSNLAITVSIALFSVVLLASFMGTITPLVLDKFGINPALASGPFITTTNDLLGLAIYFSIVHFLLI
ncbi:MAG: magnesium transporter [Bacteroidota bacterium]